MYAARAPGRPAALISGDLRDARHSCALAALPASEFMLFCGREHSLLHVNAALPAHAALGAAPFRIKHVFVIVLEPGEAIAANCAAPLVEHFRPVSGRPSLEGTGRSPSATC